MNEFKHNKKYLYKRVNKRNIIVMTAWQKIRKQEMRYRRTIKNSLIFYQYSIY